MKKLFLILFLFVVMTIQAQVVKYDLGGIEIPVTANTPLPTTLLGTGLTAMQLLQVYLTPANKTFMRDSLTITTEIDSITIPAGTLAWYNLDFFCTQDTLEISFERTFTITKRRVMQGMSIYMERISSVTYPWIYIRRRTASGTGIYDVTMTSY